MKTKKLLSLLLAVIMVVGMVPLGSITAFAAGCTHSDADGDGYCDKCHGVKYSAWNGDTESMEERYYEGTPSNITSETASLAEGWYIASGKISRGTINVSGNVNIILFDDCDLTVTGSIILAENSNLSIYVSDIAAGFGKITANGTSASGVYGDGNNTLTMNGGHLFSYGGWERSRGMAGISIQNINIYHAEIGAVGGEGSVDDPYFPKPYGYGGTGVTGNVNVVNGSIYARGGDGDPVLINSQLGVYTGGAGAGIVGNVTVSGGYVSATSGCSEGNFLDQPFGIKGTLTFNGGVASMMGSLGKAAVEEFVLGEGVTLYNGADDSVIEPQGSYDDTIQALTDYSSGRGTITVHSLGGEKVPVSYLAYNTSTHEYETKTVTDYKTFIPGISDWSDGWYVVDHSMMIKGVEPYVSNGNVNIILCDGCSLDVNGKFACKRLNIYTQSLGSDTGSFFAQGVSKYKNLVFEVGLSAGTTAVHGGRIKVIGGERMGGISSSLTVYGGSVEAYGGVPDDHDFGGCGIAGGDVEVYNGSILAVGTSNFAGISGKVTVKGGKVTAKGGRNGAGIGGYMNFGDGETVVIEGGEVEAYGGDYGAGIGGGIDGKGGTITINGGKVTAKGGVGAAGIGSGKNANCGTVKISNGSVMAEGGDKAAGIGGGEFSDYNQGNTGAGTDVYVTGGRITAIGGNYGADAIGSGCADGSQITPAPCKIYADESVTLYNAVNDLEIEKPDDYADGKTGTYDYLARLNDIVVQDQDKNKVSFYTISEASTKMPYLEYNTSTGQLESASVYDSIISALDDSAEWSHPWYAADGNITIDQRVSVEGDVKLILKDGCKLNLKKGIEILSGGSLTVYGQEMGTGELITEKLSNNTSAIGVGNGTELNVHGGKIYAYGGNYAAGIGGDQNKSGGKITVYDGYISAYGGSNGAGIGGGSGAAGGTFTIYGGKVDAHGSYSSGIGGGQYGAGGTVIIHGGEVDSAGNIGSGYQYGYGNMGTVIINDGKVNISGDNSNLGGSNCMVEINGGEVTVAQGTVGVGYNGSNAEITIRGGIVDSYCYYYPAIGGNADNVNVNIYGGSIKAGSHSADAIAAKSVTVYPDAKKCESFTIKDFSGNELSGSPVTEEADIKDILSENKQIQIDSGFIHTFNGEYVNNNDGTHSRKCTVCGELNEAVNHAFVNHTCVCGATNKHSFTGEYKDNKDGTHSQKCTGCDEYGTPQNHTFENHTCVCGATNEHSFTGEYKDNKDGTHSQKCTGCDEYGTPQNHAFENHTCVCGATNKHSFTGEYKDNKDGTHSQKCTGCDEYGTPQNHTFENHTCVCGATNEHSFTGEYKDNENGTHSQKCTGCDEYGAPQNHTFENHTCVCGATNEHSFTGEYKDNKDGTHSQKCTGCDECDTPQNHVFVNHTCVCGATNEHSFTGKYKDNGNGTHSQKCTECDEYGTPQSHVFKDGVCKDCGSIETIPSDNDGWFSYIGSREFRREIGISGGSYWGIRIPAANTGSYSHLSKVQVYKGSANGNYKLLLFSTSAGTLPADLNQADYEQTFTVSGDEGWITLELETPFKLTKENDIWVFFYSDEILRPITCTDYIGNADGLWMYNGTALFSSEDASCMVKVFLVTLDTAKADAIAEIRNAITPDNESIALKAIDDINAVAEVKDILPIKVKALSDMKDADVLAKAKSDAISELKAAVISNSLNYIVNRVAALIADATTLEEVEELKTAALAEIEAANALYTAQLHAIMEIYAASTSATTDIATNAVSDIYSATTVKDVEKIRDEALAAMKDAMDELAAAKLDAIQAIISLETPNNSDYVEAYFEQIYFSSSVAQVENWKIIAIPMMVVVDIGYGAINTLEAARTEKNKEIADKAIEEITESMNPALIEIRSAFAQGDAEELMNAYKAEVNAIVEKALADMRDDNSLAIDITGKTFTVTPSGKDAGKGIITVALYDSKELNRLLDVKVFELEKNEKPEGEFTQSGYVKAFWWADFDTMIPLCKTADVTTAK